MCPCALIIWGKVECYRSLIAFLLSRGFLQDHYPMTLSSCQRQKHVPCFLWRCIWSFLLFWKGDKHFQDANYHPSRFWHCFLHNLGEPVLILLMKVLKNILHDGCLFIIYFFNNNEDKMQDATLCIYILIKNILLTKIWETKHCKLLTMHLLCLVEKGRTMILFYSLKLID